MIVTKVNLYRCEHCRKKKALRPAGILLHEINCFANPDRTPYPGELSQVDGEELFGARPWWPGGTGQIFTGARWVALEGYQRTPSPDGDRAADPETWPAVRPGWIDRLHGNRLPDARPWYMRLEMLGLPQERRAEQLRRGLFLDLEERRSVRIAGVLCDGDAVKVRLDERPARVLTYRCGAIVPIASFTDDHDAEMEREW